MTAPPIASPAPDSTQATGRIGVVVIGRNEGERLERCLHSALPAAGRVVYVDSGSTDGSLERARTLGAQAVALDLSRPFTAARARNTGFGQLLALAPDIDYVQFVDGDCELFAGWLEAGGQFLDRHPDVAVVSGRLRERHPGNSRYNALCDREWDTPVGEARACGGNALMRCMAFAAAGGFKADLIAGEEPELCVRLRAASWRIWHLSEDMAWHDAAITRFGQWWTRTVRAGYAFAEGAALHGSSPARHWVRECLSILLWGLAIPLAALALALAWGTPGLLVFAVYPLQILRLGLRDRRPDRDDHWWHALFLVLGKFPNLVGLLKYLAHRCQGGAAGLIEYK